MRHAYPALRRGPVWTEQAQPARSHTRTQIWLSTASSSIKGWDSKFHFLCNLSQPKTSACGLCEKLALSASAAWPGPRMALPQDGPRGCRPPRSHLHPVCSPYSRAHTVVPNTAGWRCSSTSSLSSFMVLLVRGGPGPPGSRWPGTLSGKGPRRSASARVASSATKGGLR